MSNVGTGSNLACPFNIDKTFLIHKPKTTRNKKYNFYETVQSIVPFYPVKPWTHVMCPHHMEKRGQVVISCHASRGGERTWFMGQLGCYGPAASIVVLPSRHGSHAKGNDDHVNYIRSCGELSWSKSIYEKKPPMMATRPWSTLGQDLVPVQALWQV